MFAFSSKAKTLAAFRQSLVELSRFDAVQFQTVCEQIAMTRYAIAEMTGTPIDLDRQAEHLEAAKARSVVQRELQRLYSRQEALQREVAELELKASEMSAAQGASDSEKNNVEKSALFQE